MWAGRCKKKFLPGQFLETRLLLFDLAFICLTEVYQGQMHPPEMFLKVFLNILQISQGSTHVGVSFLF